MENVCWVGLYLFKEFSFSFFTYFFQGRIICIVVTPFDCSVNYCLESLLFTSTGKIPPGWCSVS